MSYWKYAKLLKQYGSLYLGILGLIAFPYFLKWMGDNIMADLRVSFGDVHFKNPIVISSMETNDGLEHIKQSIDSGAGGVVIKSVTDNPKLSELTKHAKYAILNSKGEILKGKIERSYVFYSRSGYSVKPIEEWASIIKEAKRYADAKDVRLIGSVGASTLEKWAEIARIEEDSGVCVIELNFGCPHPGQMKVERAGMLIGQDPKIAAQITETVVKAIDIPVVVKLTPQVNDLTAVAHAVQRAGASGVTVTNRFTGFAVNIEEGRPYIDGSAGVGGPWVRYLVLRWVSSIYSELGMPIFGTNGIYDWREAVEFIMSGATLMEVGSILMLKGYRHIKTILKGLQEFMDRKNYRTIDSMIGIASKRSMNYTETYKLPTLKSSIDQGKCTRCYNCLTSCFYGALVKEEDRVIPVSKNCIGCELCYSVCPSDAISFEARYH